MTSVLLTPACIRNGQPAKHEISVTYQDRGPAYGLPLLHLFSGGWSTRKADFCEKNVYTVEEIPTGMDGRAFLLHRDEEAVAKDIAAGREQEARYGVLIARNGQDDLCECRGFTAHGRCKHVSAMRGLIEGGHIDEPGQDAPVDSFPSPEQLAHDAKRADSLPAGFDPFGGQVPEPDADLHTPERSWDEIVAADDYAAAKAFMPF